MTSNSSAGLDRLEVKVTPNAGRNEIAGFRNGLLLVKVAAPPDKGRANRELIDFLSEKLGIRKSAVSIIRGETGRNKVIGIQGMKQKEVLRRLLE